MQQYMDTKLVILKLVRPLPEPWKNGATFFLALSRSVEHDILVKCSANTRHTFFSCGVDISNCLALPRRCRARLYFEVHAEWT
jgi:hypothetical protein